MHIATGLNDVNLLKSCIWTSNRILRLLCRFSQSLMAQLHEETNKPQSQPPFLQLNNTFTVKCIHEFESSHPSATDEEDCILIWNFWATKNTHQWIQLTRQMIPTQVDSRMSSFHLTTSISNHLDPLNLIRIIRSESHRDIKWFSQRKSKNSN